MVAVINCGDISDLLDYRSTYGKRKKYTFASPRDSWQGAQPHLALLVDDENIHWLGRAQGGQIITDRDRRVEVVDIEDFEDISLIDLRQQLPRRYKNRLGWGILPPATGSAVIQALIEMHPKLERDNQSPKPA